MSGARAAAPHRVSIRVEGTVQGVGFRPFVHRLARELGLAGFVRNDERGVLIELEGGEPALASFKQRLRSEAPPMARLERVVSEPLRPRGEPGFRIEASAAGGPAATRISPDAATCDACLAELRDPGDRRYRYPFINCTDCGPRFSIVTGIPYDRPATTMAGFEMCPACRAEYEDPSDRRFHAQPNACPDCGPRVQLLAADGVEVETAPGADPVAAAAAALREGRIVAVKGIGGYHLACRADSDAVVSELRRRKRREEKPLAIMVADLERAERLVELDEAERALLAGIERPIVVARRRADAPVAPAVAPGNPDLGVMIAYSPLHHLLLADAGLDLVMTSGNSSEEPIAFDDDDAIARLSGIADLLCVHDRPIRTRTDDSVMRALAPGLGREPLMLRRSRGWVPRAIGLPLEAPEPTLACGAELKSTFCLARGDSAYLSHHVGDLKNYETLVSYRDGIEHLQRLLEIEPAVIAHDMHPDYLSTTYACERPARAHVPVQHHHAHLAATLAEHGVTGEAAGAIFDGTGYGPDGTVWGGELLVGDLADFTRAGLLFPVRLPGGEAAVRAPWRMACAWLAASGEGGKGVPPRLRDAVGEAEWEAVAELCARGINSPLTTSVGRLFDAVAAVCGLRAEVSYEGQAAVELEAAAASFAGDLDPYPMPLIAEGPGPLVLDARETFAAAAADAAAGVEAGAIGARFHAGLAATTASALGRIAREAGLGSVVLSGGVFANRLLLEDAALRLRDGGLAILVPRAAPPGDGGIALGQAAVAAARLREGSAA